MAAACRAGELFEYELGKYLTRRGAKERGSAKHQTYRAKFPRIRLAKAMVDQLDAVFPKRHVRSFHYKKCCDGQRGEAADLVLDFDEPAKKVAISCKCNNVLLKHPRPRSLARRLNLAAPQQSEFVRAYDKVIEQHFRRWRKLDRFEQVPAAEKQRLYRRVLLLCQRTVRGASRAGVSRLYGFLTGGCDYVIVKRNRGTAPRVEVLKRFPPRVVRRRVHSVTTSIRGNTLMMRFDNGIALGCRIHNASGRITRDLSMKLSVQMHRGKGLYRKVATIE